MKKTSRIKAALTLAFAAALGPTGLKAAAETYASERSGDRSAEITLSRATYGYANNCTFCTNSFVIEPEKETVILRVGGKEVHRETYTGTAAGPRISTDLLNKSVRSIKNFCKTGSYVVPASGQVLRFTQPTTPQLAK